MNPISQQDVPKAFYRGTTQSDSKGGQIVENHIADCQHLKYNIQTEIEENHIFANSQHIEHVVTI